MPIVDFVKGQWQQKILLSRFKERLKWTLTSCYRFFISSLTLDIFWLKAISVPHFGLIIIITSLSIVLIK
jgi:hypothetical protein